MAFPWPVTEDERLLTRALASAMNIYEPRGQNEEELIQEAAANLIIKAYNQGVRDEETLTHYALRSLRQGRPWRPRLVLQRMEPSESSADFSYRDVEADAVAMETELKFRRPARSLASLPGGRFGRFRRGSVEHEHLVSTY